MSDVSIWRQKRYLADGQRLSQWAWVPRPHLKVPKGRRPLYRGLLTAISNRSWSKYLKWKDICASFRLSYKIKVKVKKFNLKSTNEILKVFDEFVSGRIPKINFGTFYEGVLFHSYSALEKLNVADYFQNLMNLQASSTSLRRNLKVNPTLYSFIATIVKHLQKCTTFKT